MNPDRKDPLPSASVFVAAEMYRRANSDILKMVSPTNPCPGIPNVGNRQRAIQMLQDLGIWDRYQKEDSDFYRNLRQVRGYDLKDTSQTPPPQMPAQEPSTDVYTDDVIKYTLRYVDKNFIPIPSEDGSIGQIADPTQMYQESVRKEAKRVARRIDGYLKQYRYCVGYALNRFRQGTMDLSSLRVYISNATKPLIELDAEFLIARVNEETNFDQEIRNILTTHTLDPKSPAYGVDPEVYIAESFRNSKRNSKVKLPEITPLMTELARDQIYGIKPSVKQAFILQKKNTELERLASELSSRISPDGYTMKPVPKEETKPAQPPALPLGFIIPRRKFKP